MQLAKANCRYVASVARFVGVTFASTLFLGGGASANTYAPDTVMEIQLVRAANKMCEPTCPEWIAMQGSIEPSTPPKLQRLLKRIGDKKLPIIIASNGGDREASLKMGRMIRARGLDVVVGKTTISECADSLAVCRKRPFASGRVSFSETNCVSACVFILASGAKRVSNENNAIVVHRGTAVIYNGKGDAFRNSRSKKQQEQVFAKARREISAYLKEMGMDDELEVVRFSHIDVYRASIDEQLRWKLVTDNLDYPRFTSLTICKTDPTTTNCVTR